VDVERWVRWYAPDRADATSKSWWHLIVDDRQACDTAGDRADSWEAETREGRPPFVESCRKCLAVADPKRYGPVERSADSTLQKQEGGK
jgi:hypothetical protein